MTQSRDHIMSMIEDQIYQKSRLMSELDVGMQDLDKNSAIKFLDLLEANQPGAEFLFGVSKYATSKPFRSLNRKLLSAILKTSGYNRIVTEKDAGVRCRVTLTEIKDSIFSFECKVHSYLNSYFGFDRLDHYIVYDGVEVKLLRDLLEECSYDEIVTEFADINSLKAHEVPTYFCRVDSNWGGIDENEEALQYIENESDAVDFFISQKDRRQKLYMLLKILENDGYLITYDDFVVEFDESFTFDLEIDLEDQ